MVPAYGHMIAVSSNQTDDHIASSRTSAEVYGANAYLNEIESYSLGETTPQLLLTSSGTAFEFARLRADVNYSVQSSVNLTDWSTIALNPGTVGQWVRVPSPFAPGVSGNQFFRLRLAPQ
jgi:hypothetical protein